MTGRPELDRTGWAGGAGGATAAARHLDESGRALESLRAALPRLERWGRVLAGRLLAGGRLLAAGNGGSAAEAQHLTAELVGRYRGDRPPLSALALHAETSSLTAIANDFGLQAAFARQVEAHGRPGDVLIVLSTSGRSANVLAAVGAARRGGLDAWALTGPAPNPLAAAADESVGVDSSDPAAVQEAHLVAIHVVCEALDEWLECRARVPGTPAGLGRPAAREALR